MWALNAITSTVFMEKEPEGDWMPSHRGEADGKMEQREVKGLALKIGVKATNRNAGSHLKLQEEVN